MVDLKLPPDTTGPPARGPDRLDPCRHLPTTSCQIRVAVYAGTAAHPESHLGAGRLIDPEDDRTDAQGPSISGPAAACRTPASHGIEPARQAPPAN
jgi:hypothetical protein